MISFAIRAVDCVGVAEKPGLRHDQQVAVPATILDEIRDLPVALVVGAANHHHGIDAHVDDASVLGEAALRHEALRQASRQAGKMPISRQFGSRRGNPAFYP
jgi:hypothetical protein